MAFRRARFLQSELMTIHGASLLSVAPNIASLATEACIGRRHVAQGLAQQPGLLFLAARRMRQGITQVLDTPDLARRNDLLRNLGRRDGSPGDTLFCHELHLGLRRAGTWERFQPGRPLALEGTFERRDEVLVISWVRTCDLAVMS